MRNEVIEVELKHIQKRLDRMDGYISLSQKWHFIHSMLLLIVGMASGIELIKFIGIL